MPKPTLRGAAQALVPLAALVLVGCATTQQTPTTPGSTASAPSTVTPTAPGLTLTPTLDHLHGLHLDADGTLVAGTHTGLFTVDADGRTARIGESDDDFMGLVGSPRDNHLFASGHPGPSSSQPNPLGLIESTDGGHTWTAKSLTGKVDFHALAHRR